MYYITCIKLHKRPMSIASNVKKLRAKKSHSLEKIARLADVSLSTVVKIEDGTNQNPTINSLSKIAAALEVKVDDLLQKFRFKKNLQQSQE